MADFFSLESKIKALTLTPEKKEISDICCGNSDCYYSLSNVTSQHGDGKRLQQERLLYVLDLLQKEREDTTFSRNCLFCKKHFVGNRSLLLNHLMEKHNLLIGAPDNIVFTNELLDVLENMLKNLRCFYCEKVFKDWLTLKEHMRKKQHKRINPKNKSFDKFYMINYLEFGKTWTDVQNEVDDGSQEESDGKEIELMDCQDENLAYICLFCDSNILDFEETLKHMKENHNFDFILLKERHHLNFYDQIKFINYIRRKVYEKECIVCDLKFSFHSELMKHMMGSGHISILPDPAKWNQPLYYFSTFENDNLLCALDVDDSECQEENLIYPEETVIPSSTFLYDENLRKNLT